MKGFARFLLRTAGWRIEGELPDVPHCILIFAPHTSNWDFVILLLARSAFGRRIAYLAKHTLFRPPIGWFFRLTDGMPVERRAHHQLVDTIAEQFVLKENLWLAMAPEGTRAKTEYWKSGFYYIALRAGIPVVPTALDAPTKTFKIGKPVTLTGDPERDLEEFRTFYAGKRGIYPENAGLIRFRS